MSTESITEIVVGVKRTTEKAIFLRKTALGCTLFRWYERPGYNKNKFRFLQSTHNMP